MSKITRVLQKIFGSDAGTNQRAQIGSLAAGAPAFTTDPEQMQALGNYEQGLFGTVIGQNSPALEDMNSLYYLITRQIAYLLQQGVAEWNDETDYHINGMCSRNGQIYVSLVNDNLGFDPLEIASTPRWKSMNGSDVVNVDENYYVTAADNGKTLLVDASAGNTLAPGDLYYDALTRTGIAPGDYPEWSRAENKAVHDWYTQFAANGVIPWTVAEGITRMNIFLPEWYQIPIGFKFRIKDVGYDTDSFATHPCMVLPGALSWMAGMGMLIDNFGAFNEDPAYPTKMAIKQGCWEFLFDGTQWWCTMIKDSAVVQNSVT